MSSGVNVAWRERADVQHAEHLVGEDERDAEEALDLSLAEDRAHLVGMGDVLERDRPALGRDAAREPFPERGAHALPHDLLESDCRAGDELASGSVEEEDGGRVRLEGVPDPRQQLCEELVEIKVRQGSVGDELQPSKPFGVAGGGHVAKDMAVAATRKGPSPGARRRA